MKKIITIALLALTAVKCEKEDVIIMEPYVEPVFNAGNCVFSTTSSDVSATETEWEEWSEWVSSDANSSQQFVDQTRTRNNIQTTTVITTKSFLSEDNRCSKNNETTESSSTSIVETETESRAIDNPSYIPIFVDGVYKSDIILNSTSDWYAIKDTFPLEGLFEVDGDISVDFNSTIITTELNPVFNRITNVSGCVDMKVPNGWFDFENLESIGCGVDIGDGIKIRAFNYVLENNQFHYEEIDINEGGSRVYVDGSSAPISYGSRRNKVEFFIPSSISQYNVQVRYGTAGTSCYNVCGIGSDSFSESKWSVSEINISDQNDDRKLVKLQYKINGSTRAAKIIQFDY